MNVAANTCHKMSSNDCDTNVKECGGEMRGNIMFKKVSDMSWNNFAHSKVGSVGS